MNLRRHRGAAAVPLLLGAAAALAGCGGGESTASPVVDAALPQGSDAASLDPAEMTTEIDNPYWPMSRGSRWVYRESDAEGGEQRIVVTVTNREHTTPDGIEALVVRDVATEDGEPVEKTDDWYAQDPDGNVWYLGENTAEYENGKPVSTEGSFEHGADGAQAGVIMPAHPEPGLAYREEYSKGQAEDHAEVLAVDEMVEVPAGHYTYVLLTRNLNPLEPKVEEHKFYAEGVGPVLALDTSGGTGREELLTYREG